MLVHQDAEIVDPEFCAQAAARRSRDPDVGVVGLRRRYRRAQHRLVGGRGDWASSVYPLRRARWRGAARLSRLEGDVAAARRATGRGRGALRRSAGALAVGRAELCASTNRSACCTAMTTISACRSRAAGRKVVAPTWRSRITTRWSWSPIPRPGPRRTCASPSSGTATLPGDDEPATGSNVRAGPKRGGGGAGCRPRRSSLQAYARAGAGRASSSGSPSSASWRMTAPLRGSTAAVPPGECPSR